MAVHASHAALPYPIKGARFSFLLPYLDADGDPTAPTTPDTEFSLDNGAGGDCAEEASATSGMDGMALFTLTGAETNGSCVAINAKVASGPKATLATFYPRTLPSISTGTLSAGSASGGTLNPILDYDIRGCFIKTTGGTGGGGTGGANNQARKIATYNTSTGAFTVDPDFETAVSTDTTYAILLPEGVTVGMLTTLIDDIDVETAVTNAMTAYGLATRAQGQTDMAAALVAYDPPTNAEMEARTLVAADYGTSTAQIAIAAYIDTEVAAIKAKTDNLPASPAAVGSAMTLTSAYDLYLAEIQFTRDEANDRDEWTVKWSKNGVELSAGITTPTIQIVKRADGTDLVASTSLTAIGSTGVLKYDEATNRVTMGEAVIAVATATIDGSSRVVKRLITRDSA